MAAGSGEALPGPSNRREFHWTNDRARRQIDFVDFLAFSSSTGFLLKNFVV